MLKVFLITLAFVATAISLLGIGVFFFKRKFPNLHVGGNKALNKKGIYCVQTQDYMEYNNIREKKEQKRKTVIHRKRARNNLIS
jgi:hypothetical protein